MISKKRIYLIINVICAVLISVTACSKEGVESDSPEVADEVGAGSDDVTPKIQEKDDSIVETNENEKEVTEITMDNDTSMDEVLSPWCFKTEGGISSSPVIKDNIIYFGSRDGNFYAVDINTHTELWRYTTGNPILCQAAILDNAIFFSSKEVYYALDTETGAEIWKLDLQPEVRYTVRKDTWDYHDSSPVIDQGIVYFGSGTGCILGFDAVTGETAWEFQTENNMSVRSTPIIQEGVIYFGDWSGRYYAVEIASKLVKWVNRYSFGFPNSAVIKDDTIIIGGRDTKIHALSTETGESIWSFTDPIGSWISGDPIVDGELVYFPTSDAKKVYAMDIADGEIVYTYPVYKNSFSKAIIDNNLLYVTSGDAYAVPGSGKLEVFELGKDGASLWEVNVETGSVFTTPLIKDGMVYFGSEDGCLYAEVIITQ